MKLSKVLLAALAVMMIFAIAPLASAGTGTVDDPYEVLYVGWSWEYGTMAGQSMGYFNGAAGHDISDTAFEVDGNYFHHVYVDLDTFYNPVVPSELYDENSTYWEQDYDMVVVDMLFSQYLNPGNAEFVNALDAKFNGTGTKMVSVFSEDYMTGTSYAPVYFDVRDTEEESAPLTAFADEFFYALDFSGATSFSATWDQYETICGMIAAEL